MTSRTISKGLLGLAAGLSLAFAGIAGAADNIKIGTALSVTGPASFLGSPELKTLQLYVDKVNAEGGIKGRKLELVHYDTGGDAGKARTYATRLVQDDIVVMLGPSTTGGTMAVIPVFEGTKIPLISFAAGSAIIDPVKKWIFRTPQSDTQVCQKLYADIKARGLSKVALLSGTDGFGSSMREQCVKLAPGMGIQIVRDETFSNKDADMTPQLTNIKNTPGVEALVIPGIGQGPAIAVRNYGQLAMKLPVYVSHGVASKEFIKLAGPASEGIRLPVPALLVGSRLAEDDPQRQPVLAYVKAYEDYTGEPVSAFGAFAHDGIHIAVEAMRRAKELTPAAIRDEIEKTKGYVGVNGIYTMTAQDHMGLDLSAFKLVEIRDGEWVPVGSN